MQIRADFDSGNILVLDQTDPQRVQLAIRKDTNSAHFQWFHFKVEGLVPGQCYGFELTNAGQAAYPHAWDGYQAVASYDQQHYFRVATTYEQGVLRFQLTAQSDTVWFCYFEPYSRLRHTMLMAKALNIPGVALPASGRSVDGRVIDLVHVPSRHPTPRKVWIIAQQHPGEHMAEWFMEGLIEHLANGAVPALEYAEFYLVPNMNPDGTVAGHLRTNAAGVDLNRAWQSADPQHSPEVYFVLQQMQQTGVDIFLDIHGDEAIPYVFTAGCEGNPGYTPAMAEEAAQFRQRLLDSGAEYQTEQGYPVDAFGEANLTLACNAVGERFGCMAFTLEMPFKDHDLSPNLQTGFNGARAKRLGQDVLDVLGLHLAATEPK